MNSGNVNSHWQLQQQVLIDRLASIAALINMNWLNSITSIIPAAAEIEIHFDKSSSAVSSSNSSSNRPNSASHLKSPRPVYRVGDVVSGQIVITSKDKQPRLQHNGIRVECTGEIQTFSSSLLSLQQQEAQSAPYVFTQQQRELQSADIMLVHSRSYPFSFKSIDLEHDSYSGTHVRLRYALTVKIMRPATKGGNIEHTTEFLVHNDNAVPTALLPAAAAAAVDNDPPVRVGVSKLEIGIEDCLHLEFDFHQQHYHLNDLFIGTIYFVLVKINIVEMELLLVRREICGSGNDGDSSSSNSPPLHTDMKTLGKFEIMDGCPSRTETIPIRMFLQPYAHVLTPTFINVHNKFTVQYFINLVLIDDEGRRYFKQQEIVLHRQAASSSSNGNSSSGSRN